MANSIIPQTPAIKNPKAIQKKSRSHTVIPRPDGAYTVVSGTSGEQYVVTIFDDGGRCTCPWQTRRKSAIFSGCSHVVSVYNHLANQAGRIVSVWNDRERARRQHRPVREIGDGVTLTTRLAPAPILWTRNGQTSALEVLS